MEDELRPRVIKQGDYLAKLAYLYGFTAEDVWNHDRNAALKSLREDPNLLYPGDILYLPKRRTDGRKIIAGAANTYRAKLRTTTVHVRFQNAEQDFANHACVLAWNSSRQAKTTDSEGAIEFEVPVTVRHVTVDFLDLDYQCQLDVGGLNPANEADGTKQRLYNMGYRAPDAIGRNFALERFEHHVGAAPGVEIWEAVKDHHQS